MTDAQKKKEKKKITPQGEDAQPVEINYIKDGAHISNLVKLTVVASRKKAGRVPEPLLSCDDAYA